MRVLGIDHGTVRIGVALSDPLGMLARPLETVAEPEALRRLPGLIQQHGVQTVVLGLPLRLDGTEGPAAERVRGFLAKLRPLVPAHIPIHLRDESLTTIEAESHLQAAGKKKGRGPHEKIDQAAAAVILQEYLDEQAGSSLLMPELPEDEA